MQRADHLHSSSTAGLQLRAVGSLCPSGPTSVLTFLSAPLVSSTGGPFFAAARRSNISIAAPSPDDCGSSRGVQCSSEALIHPRRPQDTELDSFAISVRGHCTIADSAHTIREATNDGPLARPAAFRLSLLLDALDPDYAEAGLFTANLGHTVRISDAILRYGGPAKAKPIESSAANGRVRSSLRSDVKMSRKCRPRGLRTAVAPRGQQFCGWLPH
jgi:hypothetical protein